MTTADLVGWFAGSLVLTAFYVKTMLPLRCVALASNVAFIVYALLAGATPILALHALLLPLNLLRLYQIWRRGGTAACAGAVELASLDERKIRELFYRNPELGARLIRLALVHREDIGEDPAETPAARRPPVKTRLAERRATTAFTLESPAAKGNIRIPPVACSRS